MLKQRTTGSSFNVWRVVSRVSSKIATNAERPLSQISLTRNDYSVERAYTGKPIVVPAVNAVDLTRARKPASGRLSAFTLIEFIGVLAVMALLAATLAPVIVKRIDLAAYQTESTTLQSLSDALVQHILRSNNIPDQTFWARSIGGELNRSISTITNNPRRYTRAYLIEDVGWLNTALASGSWNQAPGGETNPPSGRLMIVSSMGRPLPVSSGKLTGTLFSDIWNTPTATKPNTSTWTNWACRGDDLLVQRINLTPLFHRLILVNGIGGRGYFSISTNAPAPVPLGGAGTNTFYLDGTVLNLYGTNATNLLVREVIRTDMSRVFENGLWRDQINVGLTNTPPASMGLGSLAAQFFTNSPPPVSPNFGESPQGIVGIMTSYMNGYTAWAAAVPACFAGPGGSGNDKFGPYTAMSDAIRSLQDGGLVP